MQDCCEHHRSPRQTGRALSRSYSAIEMKTLPLNTRLSAYWKIDKYIWVTSCHFKRAPMSNDDSDLRCGSKLGPQEPHTDLSIVRPTDIVRLLSFSLRRPLLLHLVLDRAFPSCRQAAIERYERCTGVHQCFSTHVALSSLDRIFPYHR